MKMSVAAIHLLLFIAILAAVSLVAEASDPDPLQDFCVAVNDTKAAVFVNGLICKDPETVTVDDFIYSSGLNRPQNITSPSGSLVSMVFVGHLPGLNTQGVGMIRVDFAPNGGLNPPHWHPRASEIFMVLEGTLYAGFVASNPPNPNDRNRLFAKILHPGDAIVFPRGLIHFQYNVGKTNAVAFAGFNSQNPGVQTGARSEFGSYPHIWPEVLAGGLQVDVKLVEYLQSLPWIGNNAYDGVSSFTGLDSE